LKHPEAYVYNKQYDFKTIEKNQVVLWDHGDGKYPNGHGQTRLIAQLK